MNESASRRIYLDHAATSFPKPAEVGAAMLRYLEEIGSAPGRSTTRRGLAVQKVIDRCRQQAAQLFGATRPEHVIFTLNGTDSLHLAIHGLLREKDRVVTTVWEHNSVLRPLHQLQKNRQVDVAIVPDDRNGRTCLDQYRAALESAPRLVILNHASNVTGIVQPVAEMARLAHEAGAFVLLDAAQTAGVIPVRQSELPVDLIACPGHKGLPGPLGTGLLVLSSGMERELIPVRLGGTGSQSESPEQPEMLPDRYESGNLNAPGLFGLDAALQARFSAGELSHGFELIPQFLDGLESLPGVQVLIPDRTLPRVPVFSVRFERLAPHVVSTLLDEHFGIETR
ncbi:MAG TPA: aminotransferase class V-fold PLP-dependent enzyme, partial [Planctomicrobium sp.]|nr:aminotransferase class V-fold PLP-dependent enzyme [Planctomicrobium sp.]